MIRGGDSMESVKEIVKKLRDSVQSEGRASSEDFKVLEEALGRFPTSPELWCLKGDLIQLSDGPPYSLEDALKCYERALVIDPSCAEACQEIGYYHDVVSHDYGRAESAFRKAVRFGAGVRSYEGLARVLAELGRPDEALRFLAECPDDDEGRKQELENEIRTGIWGPERKEGNSGEE
jgi:tetratricopeptide (TPR) repeat protein